MPTDEEVQQEDAFTLPRRNWHPAAWTTAGRKQSTIDPLDLPYTWVTEEVSHALDRIVDGDVSKRRRTIMMMADAVASGNQDIGEVLANENTVGHSAWYQRMKGDETVEEVYAICLRAARHWYDQLEGHRLLKRASVVEESRDKLVDLTGVAIDVLADMLGDPNTPASVRRQLVVDVLDRADEETATKSTHVVQARNAPSMKEAAAKLRERPDRSLAISGGQTRVMPAPSATITIGDTDDADELVEPEEEDAAMLDASYYEADFSDLEDEDGTVGD